MVPISMIYSIVFELEVTYTNTIITKIEVEKYMYVYKILLCMVASKSFTIILVHKKISYTSLISHNPSHCKDHFLLLLAPTSFSS